MKKIATRFSETERGFLNFALGFSAACSEQERRPDYFALANAVVDTPAEGVTQLTSDQLTLIDTALFRTLQDCPPPSESRSTLEELHMRIHVETPEKETKASAPIRAG